MSIIDEQVPLSKVAQAAGVGTAVLQSLAQRGGFFVEKAALFGGGGPGRERYVQYHGAIEIVLAMAVNGKCNNFSWSFNAARAINLGDSSRPPGFPYHPSLGRTFLGLSEHITEEAQGGAKIRLVGAGESEWDVFRDVRRYSDGLVLIEVMPIFERLCAVLGYRSDREIDRNQADSK